MSFTTLITAAELKQHLDNPVFVVLDCRSELTDPTAGASAFAAGHIPGAQHADSDRDLSDKGVVFTEKPTIQAWGRLQAQFVDQDGNNFILVERTSLRS